jgi:glutamate-1-semialdehyde aminotransferase
MAGPDLLERINAAVRELAALLSEPVAGNKTAVVARQ